MSIVDNINDLFQNIYKVAEVKVALSTAVVGGVVEVVSESTTHGVLYNDLEWFVLICKVLVYGFGAIGVLRGFYNWVKKQKK